jgi:tetratricopeptide (TPR) repeat protein
MIYLPCSVCTGQLEAKPEHFITLPLVGRGEESAVLPLAINVVAKYWGEDLASKSQGPAPAKGALLIDGIELAERRGFACYIYKGTIRDVKRRIDQGIPPIAITPGIQDVAQHATVVSGYDSDERRILTYVPEPDAVGAVPEAKFDSDWEQDDSTMIILIPADMRDLLKNDELRFAKSNRMCFEAERLRHEGNAGRAAEKLRQATEADPENAAAWSQLGGVYNEQGSEQAVACYERAVKLNPRYYLAYRGLGNYYLKKKDYPRAESYYAKAIGINPSRFGPIYKNRAVTRMQLGNNAGAKEDLREYLKQTPGAQDRKDIEDAMSQL